MGKIAQNNYAKSWPINRAITMFSMVPIFYEVSKFRNQALSLFHRVLRTPYCFQDRQIKTNNANCLYIHLQPTVLYDSELINLDMIHLQTAWCLLGIEMFRIFYYFDVLEFLPHDSTTRSRTWKPTAGVTIGRIGLRSGPGYFYGRHQPFNDVLWAVSAGHTENYHPQSGFTVCLITYSG